MILVVKEKRLRSVWHPWDTLVSLVIQTDSEDLTSGLVSPDKDFVSDSMAHSLSREPEPRKEILCSGFSLLREHMGFLKANIDEIF